MKYCHCQNQDGKRIASDCEECGGVVRATDWTKKPKRGGARKGAGRKPGVGTGRTVTTSSINLPPELWDRLDALRGELTRSAWIAAKIKNARL